MIPSKQIRTWIETAKPSAFTANKSIGQRLLSARTAAWTLLIPPVLEGKALLIVKTPSASVFLLSSLYSEVHVVVSDTALISGLQNLFNELCCNVRVYSWSDAEALVSSEQYHCLIVENALMSFGVVRTRKLCDIFRSSYGDVLETIIVSRNPFGLGVLRERLRLKRIKRNKLAGNDKGVSWKAIYNLMRSTGATTIERYEMYPNATAPREILGPWGTVPTNRVGRFSELLGKLGVMHKLHNGYLFMGTNRSAMSSSFLSEALGQIASKWRMQQRPEVVWFRCLETGSVILELRNYRNERAILKVSLSTGSANSIQRHRDSLTKFIADFPWASQLVPAQLAKGECYGVSYILESCIRGVSGNELVHSGKAVVVMSDSIAALLKKIHNDSAKDTHIDEAYYDNHIGIFFSKIRHTLSGELEAMQELDGLLKRSLLGISVSTGFAHGDFNSKNVLFDRNDYGLTGVIDWDHATYGEVPLRDLVHFLVSIFRYRDDISYGSAILLLVTGEAKFERELIDAHALEIGIPPVLINAFLTVCWLRYIADTLFYNQAIRADEQKLFSISSTGRKLIEELKRAGSI